MKCTDCQGETTPNTAGSLVGMCEGCLDRRTELAEVRQRIDRALRVIQALIVPNGKKWPEGTVRRIEWEASLDELCDMRARERELETKKP